MTTRIASILHSLGAKTGRPALRDDVRQAEEDLGWLPDFLERLWSSSSGVLLPNGIHLYGAENIAERNKTFEVAIYAGPDAILIGDDSGGRGLLVTRGAEQRLRVVDLGSLDLDDAKTVTDDVLQWLADGAAL